MYFEITVLIFAAICASIVAPIRGIMTVTIPAPTDLTSIRRSLPGIHCDSARGINPIDPRSLPDGEVCKREVAGLSTTTV